MSDFTLAQNGHNYIKMIHFLKKDNKKRVCFLWFSG